MPEEQETTQETIPEKSLDKEEPEPQKEKQ